MVDCRSIPSNGRDRYLVVLIGVCLAQVVLYSKFLVVPDLVSQYPFMGGDSQDWIANGLSLAGFDVRYSVRPPLLPIVISVLERIGLLQTLPILLLLMNQLVAIPLYLWLYSRYGSSVAFLMSIALIANYSWLGLGIEIMADMPAASLLFVGSWCFVRAAENHPRWYLAGGLLVGLSAVTQQLALLFPVPAAAALFVHRRDHFRMPQLYIGAILGITPFAAWSAYKVVTFGTAGDVAMPQWGLIEFHLDSVGRYGFTAVSILGLPLAVAALIGFVSLIVQSRHRVDDFFVAGMIVVILFFVVLLYQHHAKRLLLYAVPFLMIAAAETLRLIRHRVGRNAAVGLLVATSLMPLPAEASGWRWAAAWPLPPTYVHKFEESRSTDGKSKDGGLRFEVFDWPSLFKRSLPVRVAEATKLPLADSSSDPEISADADSVVWIHDVRVTPLDRYHVGLRIGNVLRKRVKHIPLDLVQPFLHNLRLSSRTGFEGWDVWQVHFDEVVGSWLVLAERGGRTHSILAGQQVPDEGRSGGESTAQRIVELAGRQPVVVLVDPGESHPSLVFLPFLAQAPEFFVFTSDAFERRPNAKNDERLHLIERIDTVAVSEIRINDKLCTLVEFEMNCDDQSMR
jgi:hypothetical protein